MLETIKTIIYIIYFTLILLITIFNIIVGRKKVKKAEGNTEEVKDELESSNYILDGIKASSHILGDYLLEAMEQAEKSGMTGLAKKAYVVSLVIQKCAEYGYDYNKIKEEVQNKIETLINFSKIVNPRSTTKEKEEIKENDINRSETAPERFS